MFHSLRRMLFLGILAMSFGVLSPSLPVAHAQGDNWEYVPELGGYLDWDTGLVWSEQVGISTWDGSVAYASRQAARTGFPWRLATLAECQTAAANGICDAIPSTATGRTCWTADAKNKGGAKTAHYAVNFITLPGNVLLYSNKSLIDCILVYRAF